MRLTKLKTEEYLSDPGSIRQNPFHLIKSDWNVEEKKKSVSWRFQFELNFNWRFNGKFSKNFNF